MATTSSGGSRAAWPIGRSPISTPPSSTHSQRAFGRPRRAARHDQRYKEFQVGYWAGSPSDDLAGSRLPGACRDVRDREMVVKKTNLLTDAIRGTGAGLTTTIVFSLF